MSDEFVLEFKRQVVHLLVGLFEAVLVLFLKPVIGVFILVPLFATICFLYYSPRLLPKAPGISHLIHHFEREADVESFPFRGAFFFNVGIVIPVLLLDTPLASAVIAILAFGDSSSTLIGKFYGKHRIGRKSLEGLLAFFVGGSVGAAMFVSLQFAVILAVVGGLVEFFIKVNDNLSIPIILTGFVIILNFLV